MIVLLIAGAVVWPFVVLFITRHYAKQADEAAALAVSAAAAAASQCSAAQRALAEAREVYGSP